MEDFMDDLLMNNNKEDIAEEETLIIGDDDEEEVKVEEIPDVEVKNIVEDLRKGSATLRNSLSLQFL